MKVKRILSVMLSVIMVLSLLPTVAFATEEEAILPITTWWFASGKSRDVQSDAADVTFVGVLNSAPTDGTVFKVYASEYKTEEAGTAVLTGEKELTITLNSAPTRDTMVFVTATAPEHRESNLQSFGACAYKIADGLQFSYAENTGIPYYEFYQDETEYDIVLPTGTDLSTAVSVDVLLDGSSVGNASGALSEGNATLTATVNETEYTVNFTTMALEGEGTEEKPYLISSEEELWQLATCFNSSSAAPMDADSCGIGNYCGYYFKLTDNLDMSDVDWEPIGHSGSTYFAANFDGDGYEITNITSDGKTNKTTYDYTAYSTAGLFGWAAFGTIKNVAVRNAHLSAVGLSEMSYAGGIMAVAYNSTVENCAVYNSEITASRVGANVHNAGGIVGMIAPPSTFKKCASVGNTITGGHYVGGFLGAQEGYDDSTFTDCYVADCSVIGLLYPVWSGLSNPVGAFAGASQGDDYILTNVHLYNNTTQKAENSLATYKEGLFIGAVEYGDTISSNSYYYTNGTTENDAGATAKTVDEFKDGTVAALLGNAFEQGEEYPILKNAVGYRVSSISLDEEELTLEPGDEYTFTATVLPDYAKNKNIIWSSSDKAVATVDANGKVTVLDYGTAIITAKAEDGERTATCEIKAKKPYTITFDANGGTVDAESDTTDANGKLTALPEASRSGYTFDGWFTEAEDGEEITADTVFTADTTVYAQWTKNTTTGGGGLQAGGDTSRTGADEYDNTVTDTEDKDENGENASEIPSDGWQNPFYDVSENDWFYDNVKYTFDNGLMNGTSSNLFSPGGAVTRAMLVTVLYRAEGSPATNRSIPFADIDMGAYYASAVIWAQQNGIVKGYSETKFGPNDPITREQIATIIHRYAGFKGYDVSVGENTNILSYADVAEISEYAIPAMQYAAGSGIMKGKTETTLNPKDNTTRAEMAAILQRFIQANK